MYKQDAAAMAEERFRSVDEATRETVFLAKAYSYRQMGEIFGESASEARVRALRAQERLARTVLDDKDGRWPMSDEAFALVDALTDKIAALPTAPVAGPQPETAFPGRRWWTQVVEWISGPAVEMLRPQTATLVLTLAVGIAVGLLTSSAGDGTDNDSERTNEAGVVLNFKVLNVFKQWLEWLETVRRQRGPGLALGQGTTTRRQVGLEDEVRGVGDALCSAKVDAAANALTVRMKETRGLERSQEELERANRRWILSVAAIKHEAAPGRVTESDEEEPERRARAAKEKAAGK